MNLLDEIRFERLLSRYQKTFGEQPPIENANVEDAIAFMKARLGSARLAAQNPLRFEGHGLPTATT